MADMGRTHGCIVHVIRCWWRDMGESCYRHRGRFACARSACWCRATSNRPDLFRYGYHGSRIQPICATRWRLAVLVVAVCARLGAMVHFGRMGGAWTGNGSLESYSASSGYTGSSGGPSMTTERVSQWIDQHLWNIVSAFVIGLGAYVAGATKVVGNISDLQNRVTTLEAQAHDGARYDQCATRHIELIEAGVKARADCQLGGRE